MNPARGAAAALSWLVVIAACGAAPASTSSPGTSSGPAVNVSGVVDRGTVVPTCPTDEPCDPPAVAVMLVFSRPGQAAVTVRVRGDGTFALLLDPGDYTIAAQPPPFHSRLEPSSVRVPGSGSVQLRLRIVGSAA